MTTRLLTAFQKKLFSEWMSEHFLGVVGETRGGALTSKQKFQIFSRYMANPGYQAGVAEETFTDQTTVCKTRQ